MDHQIGSIQDFIAGDIKSHYKVTDLNLPGENIFHSKMVRNGLEQNGNLCREDDTGATPEEKRTMRKRLHLEAMEIFNGGGVSKDYRL